MLSLEVIPLYLNCSLTNDVLFKETFANKNNRKQLEFLLELLLDYPPGLLKDKLEVEYESPLEKDEVSEKSVRGDIIIRFDDTTINLEAYRVFDSNSIDKSLYYVMRIQAKKLMIGDNYYKLGKTIQINFVDHTTLKLKDDLVANFHIAYDDDSSVKLMEKSFVVKVVQIDKARKLGYTKNDLERWLKFIGAETSSEREEIAKGDELLMELHEWVKKYVADEETQEKLNKWDIHIAENKGYEQGIQEGIQEGIKSEKIEIAKKLIKMNMPLEDIKKITNLSKEEIKKLKEEM